MRRNRLPATRSDNWRAQFQGPVPVVTTPLGIAVRNMSQTMEAIQGLMIEEPEVQAGTWSNPELMDQPPGPEGVLIRKMVEG